MVAMPSNSLETVRAAVAAQVPKPFLPDPRPPYPVSDFLDSKRLGALKMKLSIGITGVEKLSSSELLTLIDTRFPERASADPRTSLIISEEVLLHADGNVTQGTQVPDKGTFRSALSRYPPAVRRALSEHTCMLAKRDLLLVVFFQHADYRRIAG